MITLFAVPRPFIGHTGIIQRNAIRSWQLLRPACEIILYGEEEGLAQAAYELGVKHVKKLKKNEFSTPFLNDAYRKAAAQAHHPLIAYVNADIILMHDFLEATKRIHFSQFMMVGRRWNLDVTRPINFQDPQWEFCLRKELSQKGELFLASAMDYCLFPRDFNLDLPAFTVGRSGGSDNWQLYRAHSRGLPIVDVTDVTTVVHQNHANASDSFKAENREAKRIETQRNMQLRTKFYHAYTLRDVDWQLTGDGLQKRKLFLPLQSLYWCFGGLLTFYPYFAWWKKAIFFPLFLGVKAMEKTRNLLLKRRKPA